MSSLTSLNSIYSLIKLCLIDVVDIPLESHVLYQHFYSNSLISTENAQKPFSRKRPVSYVLVDLFVSGGGKSKFFVLVTQGTLGNVKSFVQNVPDFLLAFVKIPTCLKSFDTQG